MKTRLLGALVGLAISFALPTFGQQKEKGDPQLIEQLNALSKKFDETVNNNDAAGMAALFTEDAVFVTDTGPLYGRQAIEKQWAEWFKGAHHSNHTSKPDANSPRVVGTPDKIAYNGDWSETDEPPNGKRFQLKGYWFAIDTREGDAWKIWMLGYNITPAPAPTNTAPTSSQKQKAVDPQTRQQIEAVNSALDEAWHKHDAAAAAAQYALDAIRVLDWTGGGTLVGREAIEKDFAANFASSPPDITGNVIQLYAIGDQIADISQWSNGIWQGYSSKIYVRDADTWKIRIEYLIGSAAH